MTVKLAPSSAALVTVSPRAPAHKIAKPGTDRPWPVGVEAGPESALARDRPLGFAVNVAPVSTASTHHRIAIVGSGFAGLGAAIKLKQAGIEDFVVLERTGDVGGTWNVNTYPGCQCDVPSHLYSFSFAPNPGWTRTYSLQPEIWEYLRRVCASRASTRTSAFTMRSRPHAGTRTSSCGGSRRTRAS